MGNGWIIGILGVWVFVVPFAGLTPLGYSWSYWVVGAACAMLGLTMTAVRPLEGWVTGAVGAWLFVSGFLPDLLHAPGVWWNNLVAGVLLAIFGCAAARRPHAAGITTSRAP